VVGYAGLGNHLLATAGIGVLFNIERTWSKFARANLDKERKYMLRRGSRFKKAVPWVEGVVAPAMPTKMMSNVTVLESWLNPLNMEFAKKIIQNDKAVTLRELAERMLMMVEEGKTEYPYVWWVWPHSSKKRAIHEDSNGITFVKLDNKWQMIFSIQAVGVLAGAQGRDSYEDLPPNAYFVSWENEEIARQHY